MRMKYVVLTACTHSNLKFAGPPTAVARNATPVAYPGSPLHLSVEFCANPPAFAARWLHGDRVYTPGNQYGIDVLAYGVIVSIIFCTSCHYASYQVFIQFHEPPVCTINIHSSNSTQNIPTMFTPHNIILIAIDKHTDISN